MTVYRCSPKADGSISIDPSLLEPELISGAHAAGVKVLISIGGADAAQAPAFSTVASSAALRKTFARNVHNFVTANGYDGVDIDWEVPNAPADTQPCILLMQALRAEMPSPGFLLSMAIGANPPGYGTGFDVTSLAPLLDFINVMTYDFHGPWSNHAGHNSPMILSMSDPGLEGSLTDAMDLFEKTYGVPRQKLNFGTAFYGYDFEGAKSLWDVCNCGKTTTSVNYGTHIKQRINHLGWKSHFDNIAQAPYLLYEGTQHCRGSYQRSQLRARNLTRRDRHHIRRRLGRGTGSGGSRQRAIAQAALDHNGNGWGRGRSVVCRG